MSKILHSAQEKYLDTLHIQEDQLILEMEEFAKANSVPILHRQGAQFLEQLVLITKPQKVLEIGCAIGYTTIRIGRLLSEGCSIDTIEKSKDNIKLAKENFGKAILQDKINLLEGDAFDIMPKLESGYDIIFLDADKEDYENLLNLSVRLLNDNGTLVVDNLLWQGYTAAAEVPPKFRVSTDHIRSFNKLFLFHEKLNSSIYPIGDGIGVGVKLS